MKSVAYVGLVLGLAGSIAIAQETTLPLGPGPVENVPGQPETNIDYQAPHGDDTCGASAFQGTIGKAYGLVGTQFPIGTQVMQAGAPLPNVDDDPKRLNVALDDNANVSRLWCG